MDTMAEIEDMSFCLAGIIEQFLYPCPQLVFGKQQGKGVDVTLHSFVTYSLYRLADIDPPVQAKYISSSSF